MSSKRELVLETARQLFAERGFGSTGMDAVAERAGVSKATIYAYFKGKDELFQVMVEQYCDEQREAIVAITAEEDSTEQRLVRIAQAMMAYWASAGPVQFSRMIMGESSRFPKLGAMFVESGVLELNRLVAGVLVEGCEAGELVIDDCELVAELYIQMIRGPVQVRSLATGKDSLSASVLDRLAHEAAHMVTTAYAKA